MDVPDDWDACWPLEKEVGEKRDGFEGPAVSDTFWVEGKKDVPEDFGSPAGVNEILFAGCCLVGVVGCGEKMGASDGVEAAGVAVSFPKGLKKGEEELLEGEADKF